MMDRLVGTNSIWELPLLSTPHIHPAQECPGSSSCHCHSNLNNNNNIRSNSSSMVCFTNNSHTSHCPSSNHNNKYNKRNKTRQNNHASPRESIL